MEKFFMYDIQIDEDDILLWSLTEKSENILVSVSGYKESIFVHSNPNKRSEFRNFILKYNKTHPNDLRFNSTSKKKIYGYTTNLDNVIRVSGSISQIAHFSRYCNYRKENVVIYDTMIDARRKFLTDINGQYAGWYQAKLNRVSNSYTSNNIQHFSTSYVHYLEDYNIEINPTVLTFDIETYSDNHNAFPDENNPIHEIFMISVIIEKLGVNGSRERHLISTLESKEVDNAYYVKVDNEKQLIEEFNNLVVKTNPIIITGYNINNFDFKYIAARSALNRLEFPDRRFSKLNHVKPRFYALKNNGELKYEFPGMIDLDMYPLMKNLYSTLASFKLDYIAGEFLNKAKHPITHIQMFEGYEKSINVTDENREVVAEEIAIIGNYCLQDSQLIGELMEKIGIWQVLDQFSRILGVTMKDVFSRGQQVRGVSQIFDMATREEFIINKPDTQNIEENKYGGGYNIEPIKGIHDNVMCFDFKSLYPSIMIAYNICYTTYITTSKSDDIKPIISIYGEENCNKVECEGYSHWFIKSHVYEGILPTLMKKLIGERNKVRRQMKDSNLSSFEIATLDKRQWALKISANAMYGMLGVSFKKGMLPFRQGAESITAFGRNLLIRAVEIAVDENGCKLIYGDTDSIMVQHPDANTSIKALAYGEKLQQILNSSFPEPLEMELEKVGRILCITKKKYCYRICGSDGEFNDTLYKGIVTVRRDINKWLGQLYKEVLDECIDGTTIDKILNKFIDQSSDLLSGKIDVKQLIKPIRYTGNYKSKTAPGNVFYQYLTSIQQPPQIGETVDAIYIQNDEKGPISKCLRPYELYKDNPSDFKLNYAYYLNNASKSLDLLFDVVFSEDIDDMVELGKQINMNFDKNKLAKPFATIAKYIDKNIENFDRTIDIGLYINAKIFEV